MYHAAQSQGKITRSGLGCPETALQAQSTRWQFINIQARVPQDFKCWLPENDNVCGKPTTGLWCQNVTAIVTAHIGTVYISCATSAPWGCHLQESRSHSAWSLSPGCQTGGFQANIAHHLHHAWLQLTKVNLEFVPWTFLLWLHEVHISPPLAFFRFGEFSCAKASTALFQLSRIQLPCLRPENCMRIIASAPSEAKAKWTTHENKTTKGNISYMST